MEATGKNSVLPLTYKGRPLMRKDAVIYYGSMADKYIVMLQVLSAEQKDGYSLANRVSIQLQYTDPEISSKDRVVKTAERDGMSLICVIMGAESRDVRNATATQLLDWGFANYGIYSSESAELTPLPVLGGTSNFCRIAYSAFSCVLPKNEISSVEITVTVPESLNAPIKEGIAVGEAVFSVGGRVIGTRDVEALEGVERINFFEIFKRMFTRFLLI